MNKKMKFKEKCEICGKWIYDYDTSTGKILCQDCLKEKKDDNN